MKLIPHVVSHYSRKTSFSPRTPVACAVDKAPGCPVGAQGARLRTGSFPGKARFQGFACFFKPMRAEDLI